MIRFRDIVEASARRFPDKVAIRFGDLALTYAQLAHRIACLSAALGELGVRAGDHVAYISANSSAFVEMMFACARLGAVCEVHSIRFAPAVSVELLRRTSSRVVVVSADAMRHLSGCEEAVGRPLSWVVLPGVAKDGSVPAFAAGEMRYEDLMARGGALIEGGAAAAAAVGAKASVGEDAPVCMFYTSGTTGIPKGVVFSHAAMMSRVRCDAGAMRFAEDDVMLFVLPFFHITCVSAFVVLHVGATMVVSASSKASSVVELIERHRVTRVGLVPFHLRAMAAHLEREGGALDSLKLVIYGAEPIEEGLLDRCKRLLGCDFLQGYGMTETASSVTLLLPEHHGDPRLRKTVGKPAPGMQVKVVDERGDACAAGVPGDVLVRTDTLMLGYWRDEERTGSAVRDGWYHTEDVGFLDENGFLTLVDRKKNLIITGGENVYPQEVCRCILELSDDVEDAVVCGVPDERWGESIAAFIVRRAGSPVTECDIVDHCAARLGRMKKPRYVAFTDNLDRSASGKVPRARIDELVGLLRATSR